MAYESICLRDDLTQWDSEYSIGGMVLGSLEVDKYIIVPEETKSTVSQIIDGIRAGRSIAQIKNGLEESGIDADVERFVDLLFYKRLCTKDSKEFEGKSEDVLSQNRDDLSAMSKELGSIEIRRNLLSPQMLRPFPAVFFLGLALETLAALITLLWGPYKANISRVISDIRIIGRNPALSLPVLLVVGIALVFLSFGIHESGHVLMARRYGLYLRRVKFRLYLGFQMVVSVQIPGLCTLKPRARAFVAIAGPLANLGLALIFLLPFILIPASVPIWRVICGLLVAVNFSTFLGNLNPLMPSDGYHFLSVLVFKHPDIKPAVVQKIRTKSFGAMSPYEKAYLVLYACTILFSLYITNGLIWGLYRWIASIPRLTALSLPAGIILAVIGNALIINRFIQFLRGKSKR